MGRIIAWVLGILVAIAAAGGIWLYQAVSGLGSERVSEDVHMLTGLGGNVGVLATERGGVVVDTMSFRLQGDRIRERAESLVGGPVQLVLNTHYHSDHTHGNPAFPGGTRIVATQRTLELMKRLDAGYWKGDRAATLPNETFQRDHEVRVGDKTVRAHYLGAGHTSGDLVVLFVEDRVLHAGDLLFSRCYPSIDLEAGGSIPAWIETLDRVLELEFDRVIPGHGPLTDRAGLRAFQAFLRELWEVGQRAAAEGWSLAETLERAELTQDEGYCKIGVIGVFELNREFVIQRAWEEATGQRVEGS